MESRDIILSGSSESYGLFDNLIRSLKRECQKNQTIIRSIRFLSSMIIAFIPPSIRYRDVLGETFYAFSQFISHLNDVFLSTPFQHFRKSNFLIHEALKITSYFEVLIEKLVENFGTSQLQVDMILLIESFKACFRMILYKIIDDDIMFLNWCSNVSNDIDSTHRFNLSHYRLWYRNGMINLKDQIINSYRFSQPKQHPRNPLSPLILTHDNVEEEEEVRFHVGRRSGLKLPMLALEPVAVSNVHGDDDVFEGEESDAESVNTCNDNNDNHDQDGAQDSIINSPSVCNGLIGIHGRGGGDGSSSVHEYDSNDDCVSENYDVLDEESIVELQFSPFSITSEKLLALGEILYIIRPVVYAWTLRYIEMKRTVRGTTAAGRGNIDDPIKANVNSNANVDNDNKYSFKKYLDVIQNLDTTCLQVQKGIALAISLILEVISIKLSSMALQMERQNALKELSQNSNSIISVPTNKVLHDSIQVKLNYIAKASFKNSSRSHVFDQELRRRKFALFIYFIRSPLFDRAARPSLEMAAKFLKYIPIISSLPDYALDILTYFNKSYFRTSSSS